ncbi:p37/Cypl family ABC transporter substrate-binding protein [Mycoplasmopsis caviae]|uniref:Uncharacterized protein n=1 Tax=Mycoplasmopsis caviae TaxID=55603 RepID=A0A3P8KDC1_9BACT|nr:hypothetical protein [Mycoplasmopsis caviae]VDR42514.1 Uncharacterised protein [Mycoplasmopsis caviae]
MYEKDKFVDVQRGAIWIFGTEDERSNIKNAWINRRWDDFYNSV